MPAHSRRKRLGKSEAEEARKRWNVPNWRKTDGYAHVKNASDDQLRWEFVRRNPEYQSQWTDKTKWGFFEYGLRRWKDPADLSPVAFQRDCRLMAFPEKEPQNKIFHYDALADAARVGFMFSVDIYKPVEPQIKFIERTLKAAQARRISPSEQRVRNRRSNSGSKRTPQRLLRIIDAYNEGVPINELAQFFGGSAGISEAAMRRTVEYALNFWRRL